jgi:hypothetical protein
MKILFQCPCGKSMVAEGETAGTLVRCPNCGRQLRVPSGKDRGKELTSVPSAPSTRLCPRCGKNIPIDSSQCPQCKASLVEPAPAPAPKKNKKKKAVSPTEAIAEALSAPAAGPAAGGRAASVAILYGGYRGNWFGRLSTGAQVGIIISALFLVVMLGIAGLVIYSFGYTQDVVEGRAKAAAALADGKKLECVGKFQEAYDLYWSARLYSQYLNNTGVQSDTDLVKALEDRCDTLQYVVQRPRVRGSLFWHANSQQELDKALADIQTQYPTYRQWILGVAMAGLEAAQSAKTAGSQQVYEAKLAQAIESYIQFAAKTTPQQRTLFSYSILSEAMKELAAANRHWDQGEKQRTPYLATAEERLKYLKEMVDQPGKDTVRGQ